MRKLKVFIRVALLMGVAFPAVGFSAAVDSCAEIQCDCTALNSAVLKAVCRDREKDMRSRCEQSGFARSGSCGFSGAAANRQSVDWLPDSGAQSQLNAAKLLNLKWASSLGSVQNRLTRLDESKRAMTRLVVTEDLRQLEGAIDDLLGVQKQLAAALRHNAAENALRESWSQFSLVTASVAKGLRIIRGEVSVDALQEELTDAEAGLYEQSAYGYAQAGRFEDAAQLWKLSAEMAAELMAKAERGGAKEKIDQYRYQQSTRLHRARENWAKAGHSF